MNLVKFTNKRDSGFVETFFVNPESVIMLKAFKDNNGKEMTVIFVEGQENFTLSGNSNSIAERLAKNIYI